MKKNFFLFQKFVSSKSAKNFSSIWEELFWREKLDVSVTHQDWEKLKGE